MTRPTAKVLMPPMKVEQFLGRAVLEIIPTRSNVSSKRGVITSKLILLAPFATKWRAKCRIHCYPLLAVQVGLLLILGLNDWLISNLYPPKRQWSIFSAWLIYWVFSVCLFVFFTLILITHQTYNEHMNNLIRG